MFSACFLGLFIGIFIVFCFIDTWLLIKLCQEKNLASDPKDWYQHKFKQLITAFAAGLTLFSIIVSILTLIPRYDYERIDRKVESLEKFLADSNKDLILKNKEINAQYQKVLDQQSQIEKEQKDIRTIVYTILNEKFNPQYNKAIAELRNELVRMQGQIEILREEIKKNKTEPEKKKIDKLIPTVEIPKVEIPTVEIPKVETPKVGIP